MADLSKDFNKTIQEFERGRVQLAAVESQSQTLTMQLRAIEDSLKELKETKEEKVYKFVGTILILSDVKKVVKELTEQKETIDLRLKSVKKQEEALIDKLNKLKVEIENAQKPSQSEESKEEK